MAELMIDALVEFILIPVNKQFFSIFVEAGSRTSTKSFAK